MHVTIERRSRSRVDYEPLRGFGALTAKKVLLAACMVLGFLIFSTKIARAQNVDCTNGQTPNMRVEIYNNSTQYTIYPVLFAGSGSATDTWIQACFQLTDSELKSNPYPRASQYRMYINCCAGGENGIPPGGSATVTLPLYSPLVGSIDPTKPGQLIDWWQGGGINFFRSESNSTKPPAVLEQHWKADQGGNAVTPTSNPPTCMGCTLHFFKAPTSIPNFDPQQLTEYSLGAQPINPDHTKPGQPARLWVPDNVDFDVSYVNFAYMPAVMEPYGNPFIGYIGSPSRISDFESAIQKWSASNLATGWPLYKGSDGNIVPNKIPSVLEIFQNSAGFDNTKNFIPAPATSKPISEITKEWESCVLHNGSDPVCPRIRDVSAMLDANYANYFNVGTHHPNKWKNEWGCTGQPQSITEQIFLAHLYGWTPFLGNCTNPAANLLFDTPGYNDPKKTPNYQAVKAEFDQLQYWVDVLHRKYGTFDPYVTLVHGPDYIDAPYTYAYSVDDAVGNMQTDGTGLVIAVGGPEHLPNPDHATPNVNFPFGYSSSYDGGIHFTQYGRCTKTPDTPTVSYFTSFPVPEGIDNTASSVLHCTISMQDSAGRVYLFKLKALPPGFPTNPNPTPKERQATNSKFIDCTGDTGQVLNWCQTIYPYQQTDLTDPRAPVDYYVVMGAPPPLLTPIGPAHSKNPALKIVSSQ